MNADYSRINSSKAAMFEEQNSAKKINALQQSTIVSQDSGISLGNSDESQSMTSDTSAIIPASPFQPASSISNFNAVQSERFSNDDQFSASAEHLSEFFHREKVSINQWTPPPCGPETLRRSAQKNRQASMKLMTKLESNLAPRRIKQFDAKKRPMSSYLSPFCPALESAASPPHSYSHEFGCVAGSSPNRGGESSGKLCQNFRRRNNIDDLLKNLDKEEQENFDDILNGDDLPLEELSGYDRAKRVDSYIPIEPKLKSHKQVARSLASGSEIEAADGSDAIDGVMYGGDTSRSNRNQILLRISDETGRIESPDRDTSRVTPPPLPKKPPPTLPPRNYLRSKQNNSAVDHTPQSQSLENRSSQISDINDKSSCLNCHATRNDCKDVDAKVAGISPVKDQSPQHSFDQSPLIGRHASNHKRPVVPVHPYFNDDVNNASAPGSLSPIKGQMLTNEGDVTDATKMVKNPALPVNGSYPVDFARINRATLSDYNSKLSRVIIKMENEDLINETKGVELIGNSTAACAYDSIGRQQDGFRNECVLIGSRRDGAIDPSGPPIPPKPIRFAYRGSKTKDESSSLYDSPQSPVLRPATRPIGAAFDDAAVATARRSRLIAEKSRDDALYDLLINRQRSSVDYLSAVFDRKSDDDGPFKIEQANYSPLGKVLEEDDVTERRSEPNDLVIREKLGVRTAARRCSEKSDASSVDLSEEKRQLIASLSEKLAVLQKALNDVREEIKFNDQLGEQIASFINQSTILSSSDKDLFELHIQDTEKITLLLLKLSCQLARVENEIVKINNKTCLDDKCALSERRQRLVERLNDAANLKQDLDVRGEDLLVLLKQCLNEETISDYIYFIRMKSQLLLDAREIQDKIKLGEDQKQALIDSL